MDGGITVSIQRKEKDILSNNYTSNNQFPLFENHIDAICVIDLHGRITYANLSISSLLGYSTQELLNLELQEFIASDNGLAIFHFYFQKAMESDTQEFITEIKCKDGNVKEMKIVTISNEVEGQIVSISVFLIDIFAEKLLNNGATPKTMGLCESFIENNRDPILLLNLEAIIILANQAFSKLLGWRKENLEGFHILQCPSIPAHLVDQMGEYFHRLIQGETDLATLDTIRMDTEGKPYYMMLSITPIKESNGNLCNWAVHLRDVSAHKEVEQLLLSHLENHDQIEVGFAEQIRDPIHSLKEIMESMKSNSSDSACGQQINRMNEELNRIESLIDAFSNGKHTLN
jgi:PAS domain S-box-containing protein